MLNEAKVFTKRNRCICNRLISKATICFDDKRVTVDAIWDTGATRSAVSYFVVQHLGISSHKALSVYTPVGMANFDLYYVNVELPNGLLFENLEVTKSNIDGQQLGMLIGMDIISKGDFCVSNYRGRTTFTFCVPSQGLTNFVTVSEDDAYIKAPWYKRKK